MDEAIHVTLYPTENGKLYRSDEGIIYTSFDGRVTAMGSDIKNTKRILPIDSTQLKFFIDNDILIDDSLARRYEPDGGLDATKLVIDSKSVSFRTFRPISLSRICFNYMIENPGNVPFDLSGLPDELKNKLKPLVELKKLRDEFRKILRPKRISVKNLATQQARERKELFSSYNQIILYSYNWYEQGDIGHRIYKQNKLHTTTEYNRDLSKLDSRHSQEMDEAMGVIMSPERKKILDKINKLICSTLT
uniref:Gasdermin family protein n=1 Tax=Pithovirus LCPAC202 TaxID=2506592 RepID=A0A481Z5S9_9VIRU|nr:MAG: gasdermin family protein [Pithovirus LCPAC202]